MMIENEALLQAVINNEPLQVKDLLDQGADPNFFECPKEKIRLIHFAALYDARRVIPPLIEAGADLHAKTGNDGVTALDIAKQHSFRKTAKLLKSFLNQSVSSRKHCERLLIE
jgi:ankyrin repeat protein